MHGPVALIVPRDVHGANCAYLTGVSSLDVCLLSVEEAARFEHQGVWPACKAHRHMKRSKALALITSEEARYVGGSDTKLGCETSMIVPVRQGALWQPVPTAGLMGFRTWGLPRTL